HWRLDCFPGVEIVHALERGRIVADRGCEKLGDRFLLRDVQQEVLPCSLILGELPQAVELRELSDETAVRALRHRMRPALLRHLRVVALGDRPGARRVHDAGALARDYQAGVPGILTLADFT